MTIDCHAHIFPDDVAPKAIAQLIENAKGHVSPHTDGTLSGLLRSMEEAGIDYSIILPIATQPEHSRGIARWIAKIRKITQKIICFASLHPLANKYDIQEVCHMLNDLGVQGIKLHPQYQNFAVDSKEAMLLYETIVKNNWILHFHAGFDIGFPDSDFADASRFANLALRFPEAKIVLAHAGGYREWDKVIQYLDNFVIYYDTAFVLDHLLDHQDKSLIELYHKKQDYFLFGTDSPWRSQKLDKEKILTSPFFTEEQKQKLLYQNILRLVKIS